MRSRTVILAEPTAKECSGRQPKSTFGVWSSIESRISPSPLVLRKHPPNLGHDHNRRPQNVPRGKSEQSDPVTDETVLTSVVLGQPIAMYPTVVLDCEPAIRVVEIRPAEKAALP